MRTLSKGCLFLALPVFFIFSANTYSQTKKLKRPTSRVGVTSVDTFVRESFDLYDKVYMYDGYAQAGTPLSDDDIDVLEQALDDVTGLSDSAPNILADIDGIGVLKQSKATLQVNRAKKALKYSIKTSKELLLNNRKGETEEESESTSNQDSGTSGPSADTNGQSNESIGTDAPRTPKSINVYSKFDYVPGDKQLFFDDFASDFIGDFPSKWNTNGGGEIVTIDESTNKWYAITNRSITLPNLSDKLPEDYTVEFDLKFTNLSRQTGGSARLEIYLSETPNLTLNESYVSSSLNFCQYIAIGVRVLNRFKNNPSPISNNLSRDLRNIYQDIVHVSIAVNKNRYRLWLNESKIADLPQFIFKPELINYLKFKVDGIDLEKRNERVLISNLKIAEGGVDLRRKLLAEGKISTNGILFDSGSANIKPESMGIIRQIYQVLQQDSSINLKIVGHTDADGGDEANLELSAKRAGAVKNALVNVYNVDSSRLTTEGKGELEPVADNTTPEGKAQNRRVEFIKQ